MPERFNLYFINEKDEKERPVLIHRAISGSLERFLSIVIEHFGGKFPLWLSPIQARILTLTDRSNKFASEVYTKLKENDIRVELDDKTETIGKKVKEGQLDKVNYLITIGDKEIKSKTLAVRTRNGEIKFDVNVDKFIKELKQEISERKIR